MPITFGSVGDIIAVCLIVKDLVDALDNLRGSAAEYQEIIRELGNLEHALRQVEDLSRLFADSIEMTTLLLVAAQAVDNCKSTVNGFRDKIRKFDKSLAVNGTDNIARKVQWHVTRKEELVKFRAKVGEHCLALKMSMGYVQMNLLQINDKKLNERLGEDRAKADAVATKHAAAIAEVRELTEENNRLQVASRISDVANFQRLRNLGGDLFNLMQKTYAFNVDIYRIVKSNESTPASHLERSLIQEPFILEDAIGRRHPVYLQWTSSWESFEFTLKGHFRNMQGYKKVQNGEYVFQDHATRRDIDRSKSWTTAFLPGQIVDMSLIFRDWDDQQGESNSCRGCKRPFSEGNDAAIQCLNCGIWYQTVVHDGRGLPLPKWEAVPAEDDHPAMELTKKRSLNKADTDDDISCFKNVRYIRNQYKFHEFMFDYRTLQDDNLDVAPKKLKRRRMITFACRKPLEKPVEKS